MIGSGKTNCYVMRGRGKMKKKMKRKMKRGNLRETVCASFNESEDSDGLTFRALSRPEPRSAGTG